MIQTITQKAGASVRQVCQVLGVARSSFYHAGTQRSTCQADQKMGRLIEDIFRTHRRRYGYRRIADELHDQGVVCAPARVRRLMKERELHAIQARRFHPKTSDGAASPVAANLLENQELPARPDRVWAGDITYIPTESGWVYLAVVIDLCSRRIVGWHLADYLHSELTIRALDQAIQTRQPPPGLTFHSDRGSQYSSLAFRSRLQQSGMLQSMSAPANPYHNAWTESFIGTLKLELESSRQFESEKQARSEIFQYIDCYYNTRRKHSSLGYQSPSQFERTLN